MLVAIWMLTSNRIWLSVTFYPLPHNLKVTLVLFRLFHHVWWYLFPSVLKTSQDYHLHNSNECSLPWEVLYSHQRKGTEKTLMFLRRNASNKTWEHDSLLPFNLLPGLPENRLNPQAGPSSASRPERVAWLMTVFSLRFDGALKLLLMREQLSW